MNDAARDLLLELTPTPTAAGREHLVIAVIADWLERRPGLVRRDDPHGNIEIALDPASGAIVAHLLTFTVNQATGAIGTRLE